MVMIVEQSLKYSHNCESRRERESPMEAAIWPYAIYALSSIGLTVGLAYTLHANGKIFLAQMFPDDHKIANAINSLLVTGFFMLNLGYAFLMSRAEATSTTFAATEQLIQQLGVLLLSLGIIHFLNMAVFWKIRRNITQTAGVPTPFTTTVAPPPPPPPAPRATNALTTPAY